MSKETTVTVWCGRKADIPLPQGVCIRHYFFRKFRKLQVFWLYRRLLKQFGRILVSTASRTDMVLLNLASQGKISPLKVFLYIHWFKPSSHKRSQLRKMAVRQPELVILTPTVSLREEFLNAGFSQVRHIPYPITRVTVGQKVAGGPGFRSLLYAGAARSDKGFSKVVDLVALMARRGEQIPITLQASADHYGKLDETVRSDLARLNQIAYPHITLQAATLQQTQYQALFEGAICLQLYSRQDFADRVSGVTLDALSAGSPVITLSRTWIAGVIAEFDAGMVVDSPTPEAVLQAVKSVKDGYEFYRNNALKAGCELQTRNSAEHLFQELMS
jgi:glycosyltransferase involved in cell wall biosynthesis